MSASKDSAARAELRQRYAEVRAATDALREGLSPEDCVVQSMTEASPIQWHLAHTSWFFETFVLARAVPGYRPFDPHFGYLFNSYYETVGERVARPRRGLQTRPGLSEVLAYRAHVDREMGALLERGGERVTGDAAAVVELGLNHEQQHQELMLTDLKHLLSFNPLRPAYRPGAAPAGGGEVARLRWIPHPEGLRWIGTGGERGFAFDNEGPRHREFLEAFEIATRPVTVGEFLEFVEDEGYDRPGPWLSDGWEAVQRHGWIAPLYWEWRDGAWWTFTLGGMRPLEESEPVAHVSFYEADAYARWAGARLPTEAEWETAAGGLAVEGNFVEDGALHPRPTPGPGPQTCAGPQAMFGDVWEWTASSYAPYPGFRPPPGALGEYNGKFMCNQLVLRGGSCALAAQPLARFVPQLLLPRRALADERDPAGARRVGTESGQNLHDSPSTGGAALPCRRTVRSQDRISTIRPRRAELPCPAGESWRFCPDSVWSASPCATCSRRWSCRRCRCS